MWQQLQVHAVIGKMRKKKLARACKEIIIRQSSKKVKRDTLTGIEEEITNNGQQLKTKKNEWEEISQ